MSKNMILDLLSSYKKSAAFISAYELGVFEYMQNRAVCIEELSTALHADHLLLSLLLRYLESIDVVEDVYGQWRLKDDLVEYIKYIKKYEDIIAHEKNLFNKWVSPAYITSSIVHGLGERQFDLEGFSLDEKKIYFKAMNGKNLDIITFWIIRELVGRQDINCLEVGRSIGALSLSLKKRMSGINATIVLNKDYLSIYHTQIRESIQNYNPRVFAMECFDFSDTYDLVCMYNTIHYYPRTEAVNLLSKLRGSMNGKSVICIADIFIKGKDNFRSSVLLDWITHGGVHTLSTEDVESIMEEAGFRITKRKNVTEISTDLIFGAIG